MTDLIDVVVEQLVNQIHMWEEHSPATVARETQRVKDLAYILLLFHLLGALTNQLAEFLPFVGDHFTTTKTADWDYHLV